MGLTKLQFRILFELSDGEGYSNKELAARLGQKPNNLTDPLDELENGLFVIESKERRACKEDKRRSDYPFYLNKYRSIHALESFLEGSFIRDEELRDNFFKSNFIKFVIDNHGLMELLNLFKGFTHDRELLCNLSKRLFENKFIIDKYKKYIKKINDYPKDYNDR